MCTVAPRGNEPVDALADEFVSMGDTVSAARLAGMTNEAVDRGARWIPPRCIAADDIQSCRADIHSSRASKPLELSDYHEAARPDNLLAA